MGKLEQRKRNRNQRRMKSIVAIGCEAKKICKAHGIELITSTPAFEYWYILHYGYTSKNYQSSKQIKSEIRNIIPNYSENMDVYDIIKDKTDVAIINAKRIEKYQEENGHAIDSEESNPHTSTYKIVEELQRRLDSK